MTDLPPNKPEDSGKAKKKSLNTGAIVGIVIAVLVVITAIVVLVYFLIIE